MDHNRWAHELADYNEEIHDAEINLKRAREDLSTYKARQSTYAKFPQYNTNPVEFEKKIKECERAINKWETRRAGQTKKRDKLYSKEPPK